MEAMNFPEDLKKKLEAAESLEEVAKLCCEAGYEVTVDELKAAEASCSEELSEDDLDNVAGGGLLTAITVGMIAIGAYLIWKHKGGGHRF